MNVLKYEFKRYLPSSLIWGISLAFFGFVCIQLFVSFSSDVNFFEQMLNAYSPEMLKAFGAELSTIKTLPGFYSFCFMYVVVAGVFQSMYMGMHIVSKEISGKTADFIYTKPISRQSILIQKLIAVMLCLLITNVIYGVGTFISAGMTNIAFDEGMLLIINSAMFLTQLLFMSVGFLLACVMSKIKTPLTFTTGVVCSFFLLQMIVNLEPDGILSYISFLNYVSADSIMRNSGFDMVYLSLLVVLCIGFLSAGFGYFRRRDIHAL